MPKFMKQETFQESALPEKSIERKSKKVNRDIFKIMQDVKIRFHAELGTRDMTINEIKKLGEGSIVEFFDHLAGAPLRIYANNRLIGFGETVVVEENFGIRITEIITHEKSIKYHAKEGK